MKKHILIFFITGTLVLAVSPFKSYAGTVFVGAKAWYAEWDSGILDWLENDIGISFSQNRLSFKAERDVGDGYLVGPMIGYQTDDRKWSFSFAPMIVSDFSQDWDGSAGAMTISGDVELERQDYDLAATYSLSDYFKVFAGYKFQDMEMNFNLTYNSGLGGQTDTFDVEAQAHIPTFGAGVAYPVHKKVVIGGQAGVMYPMLDMKITNENDETDDIIPHSRLGYNTEATITFMPVDQFIIQAGYRYQEWTFKGRGPGRTKIIKSTDETYGPTLSMVYMF